MLESVLAGKGNESSISKTPSRSRPTRIPIASTCALKAVVGGAARSVYDGAGGAGRISVECFIIFKKTWRLVSSDSSQQRPKWIGLDIIIVDPDQMTRTKEFRLTDSTSLKASGSTTPSSLCGTFVT